jgi:benzoyl-CoA reductase/2-hydroxyglutaryl-CoA dehydratase subunit BcrC/BadD/HgdB
VLVFNTNQCRDVKDWFGFYAREWNVPCIGVHTPRAIGEVSDIIIEAVAKQIEALVEPLEKISGNKLDMDKLAQVTELSRKCTELWKAILETAANVPSPITFFDDTIQMGPAVVLRGTQAAVDYYEILLAESPRHIATVGYSTISILINRSRAWPGRTARYTSVAVTSPRRPTWSG